MFKKTLCTILALLIFAVPTLSFAQSEEISPAEVSATISQQIPALSEAEAMALLNEAVVTEDGQPLQVAVLSLEEMKETEGAIAPIVVYGLIAASRVAYVGRTNNLLRRTFQHTATKTFEYAKPLGQALTRQGARLLEQSAMNHFRTVGNGMNKINSISRTNPLYKQVRPWRR